MTLVAHTNAPGAYIRYETVTSSRSGVRSNPDNTALVGFHEEDVRYGIPRDFSGKPEPWHGDHKSIYSYGDRNVIRVLEDDPMLVRSRWINPVDGITGSYDYVEEHHLAFSIGWGDFPGINYLSNLYAEANVKALNDLSGKRGQLLAELAQARQTMNLFADSVIRGYNVVAGLKTGNFSRVLNALGINPRSIVRSSTRSVANFWLEYAYGWKPLAQSIYDLQQQSFTEMAKNRVIQGQGRSSYSRSESYTYDHFGPVEVEVKHDAKGKTVLRARLDSPSLASLNQLGLINPLSVAWEVTPWSFVVDWFVPVGATLDAMTATYGLDFHSGWYNKHVDISKNAHGTIGFHGNPFNEVINGGSYLEKKFLFSRDQHTAFPLPEFYADCTPFSTPRVINALALVRQLFR